MSEKNENKNSANLEEYQKIGKEFTKTNFGKFMAVVAILSFILIVIGLGLAVFEAIIYAKDLDVNKHQPFIDLGDICMEYAEDGGLLCLFVYGIMLPLLNKNNAEKDKTTSANKKEFDIATILKSPFIKVIIVLYVFLLVFNCFHDIGYIVGQIIAS